MPIKHKNEREAKQKVRRKAHWNKKTEIKATNRPESNNIQKSSKENLTRQTLLVTKKMSNEIIVA